MKRSVLLCYLFLFLLWSSCSNTNSPVETSISLDSIAAQQLFVIDNAQDTTVFGKLGTRIYIPANAFENSSTDTIKLYLKEIFDAEKTKAAGISELKDTANSADLFISIEAFADDKKAEIKKEKSLLIHIPAKYGKENMLVRHYSNNGEWQKDTSAYIFPASLEIIYERLDYLGTPKAHDPAFRRMWFKDTSDVKTFESYFNRYFDFGAVNYRNIDSVPLHLNFKINEAGNIYGIKYSKAGDSVLMHQLSSFLRSAPPLDLYREKQSDTSSVNFGMFIKKRNVPAAGRLPAGYLSSFHTKEKDPQIRSFKEMIPYYYIYVTDQSGWMSFSKK